MDDIRRVLAALCVGLAAHELIMAYGLWFIVGTWAPEGLANELCKAAVWAWAAWRVATAPRWGGVVALAGTLPWLLVWAWEVKTAPILYAPARGPVLVATAALALVLAARGGEPWRLRAPQGMRPGLLSGGALILLVGALREPLLGLMGGWMQQQASARGLRFALVGAMILAAAAAAPLRPRAPLRAALPAATLGLMTAAAALGVQISAFRVARAQFYEGQISGVGTLLYFVAITLALAAATRHVAQRAVDGAAQRAGLLVAAGVLTGWIINNTVQSERYSWEYSPDMVVGQFPFHGGTTHTYQLGEYPPADVHVLQDGSRACGSTPSDHVVALVGDSFQEGQGLSDHETLCWQLRDMLAPTHPGWHFVNLGKAGSGLTGVHESARFAAREHGADVVITSFTLRDDGRPFEITTLRRAMSTRWMFVLGGLTDLELAMEVGVLYHELFASELYQRFVMFSGLRRLSALAAELEVPFVLEVHFPDGAERGTIGDELRRRVQGDPWVLWGTDRGLVHHPSYPQRPTQIPGDGHPSAWGNTLRGQRLRPAVERAMARTSTPP